MKDEIKEILDKIKKKYKDYYVQDIVSGENLKLLLDYITNLQEENERLKELYKRTCKHLFDIGNDELARYFQAQISECNVFTTQGKSDE